MITGKYPSLRLRRNRKYSWSRKLIQENTLSPSDFILPIFLIDGSNKKESIKSMPGVYRYTINRLSQIIDKAIQKEIPMVALFPKTNPKAPSKIDFPAPVSPVIIENPSEKSIPNLSIKAKLLIESEASIKSIYI